MSDLRDVLLAHYFQTILPEQLEHYPVRLALKYAAYNTPAPIGFERVIAVTPLSKRVTVFEYLRGVVRYTFKHTQDRGFVYREGPSWTCR